MTKITNFFEKHWWMGPTISGILVTLSFFPFDLWFLIFVAFVPFFYTFIYLASLPLQPIRKIFWTGFIPASIVALALSFIILADFHWLPEAYLFSLAVQLLFFPIAIMGGLLGGLTMLFYTFIRRGILGEIFIGASIFIIIEWMANKILTGYHYGIVGYTLHSTPLINFASIGGEALLSFLVFFSNIYLFTLCFAALRGKINHSDYFLQLGETKKQFFGFPFRLTPLRKIHLVYFSITALLGLIYYANDRYLHPTSEDTATKTWGLIQLQSRGDKAFGSFKDSAFSYPRLEQVLSVANFHRPDFIIYPFAPFLGLLTAEEKPLPNSGQDRLGGALEESRVIGTIDEFAKWTGKYINPRSVFVTWNNVLRKDKAYVEFNFWQTGKLITYYQKRLLFPFFDYTPNISQKIGLYTTPYDPVPGDQNQLTTINGLSLGNSICSEISSTALAREDALQAPVLLSIGSEAMFSQPSVGDFDVVKAQFRAAETNRPVIRANRLGPSVLIDARGNVVSKMDYGKEGILLTTLEYNKKPRNTLYSKFGDMPIIGGVMIFLGVLLAKKLKLRKRQTKPA